LKTGFWGILFSSLFHDFISNGIATQQRETLVLRNSGCQSTGLSIQDWTILRIAIQRIRSEKICIDIDNEKVDWETRDRDRRREKERERVLSTKFGAVSICDAFGTAIQQLY
jgi:replicative DNA helicase